MIEKYLTVQQIWFTESPRHWSPTSEPYTGADSLITALHDGWQADLQVEQQHFLLSGGRIAVVYTFTLRLDADVRQMAIVSTPLILRLLKERAFMVVARHDHSALEQEKKEPVLKTD